MHEFTDFLACTLVGLWTRIHVFSVAGHSRTTALRLRQQFQQGFRKANELAISLPAVIGNLSSLKAFRQPCSRGMSMSAELLRVALGGWTGLQ